jgi:hypothetical protein
MSLIEFGASLCRLVTVAANPMGLHFHVLLAANPILCDDKIAALQRKMRKLLNNTNFMIGILFRHTAFTRRS